MRFLLAIILVDITCWSWSAGAAAPSIEEFAGAWQGHAEAPSEAMATGQSGAALTITLQAERGGFLLSWTGFERQPDGRIAYKPLQAAFAATERAGVFEYRPERASLLARMFASPTTGNPLSGETMLWARLETDTLVVYSLGINPDGGFDLHRYAWRRAADGMALRYSLRTENVERWIVEAGLTRAGG